MQTPRNTTYTSKPDQKASLALIQHIQQLKGDTVQNSSPRVKIKTSKRVANFDNKQTKISSWINKENQLKNKNQLDVVVKTTNSTPARCEERRNLKKEKSKSANTLRHSSFYKYGIMVPSFEKIVNDQRKFEEHKDNVKLLDVFDNKILEKSVPNHDFNKIFTGELLDCKHLLFEDLDIAFQKHVYILEDIVNRKQYSARHKKFHNRDFVTAFFEQDFRYSSSTVVFTEEQIEHLLDLLSVHFDPGDELMRYLVKVLLPELCLLIFMNEHNMGKRKAKAYLDKRPLDI